MNTEAQQQNVTLDLAQQRVIPFRVGKHLYEYLFKRITKEGWLHYFNAMHVTSERSANGVTNVVDVATAGSDLVRENVEGVNGYAESFKIEGEWRKYLPIGHVKTVANCLVDVDIVAGDDDAPIDPMLIEVVLAAAWTSTEKGKLQKVSGLVHRFAPPTAAHEQKYNRALSETLVVGGDRKGKTIYPSRQAFLIQLYDELIQSVDGYSVAGTKLEGRDAIAREMDAYHKVVAVRQLFTEPESE